MSAMLECRVVGFQATWVVYMRWAAYNHGDPNQTCRPCLAHYSRVALLIGTPGLRGDSGEVLSELQYSETAPPSSETELHWA